jgi:4-carboxymuconolactone decarboxylase
MQTHVSAINDDMERDRAALPRAWAQLEHDYPEVVAAYNLLSEVCRHAGPLDESMVALLKLAVSVGCRSQRTVHAHAKKALRAGADPCALRQIAMTALPTIGLPAALDALRWIDDSIREQTSATVLK